MVIVSIVILNYNGKQYLNDCLKSVFDITFPEPDELEVILVDNASQDGSVEFIKNNFPQVKLIYSNKNLGFAGGNNLGIKAASGKYIALLNNDTVITKEWLKGPVEIIETDSKIGIVGSKMLFLNEPGRLNNAGSYLTIDGEGGDIGFREKDTGQYDQIREVFSVCAGSCIIKREVFEQIGYFDESFFAYYEDTDLCYRAHWAGWKCFFCPDSIVFHKHCGVLGEWSPLFIFLVYRNKLFMHFKNSQLRFFARVFIKYFMSVIKDIVILRVNGKVHLKIFLSLIKNLPVLLYKRIRIRSKRTVPDATISRLLSLQPVRKDKKLLCEIKKIGIYNPSLPVMGGGENHMAVLIEEFEKL
ncbi:MAG: glycosyltransferase family 2 protein, partial [Elusimicrobiota bacterium]